MFIYYLIFLIVVISSLADISNKNIRNLTMSILLVVLVTFLAFRGASGGDGLNYLQSWNATPTVSDSDWAMPKALAYSEPIYYVFTFILKTICDSPIFYFAVMAILSMSFVFKSLKMYCIYPLIGLVVYVSRFFMLRDFNQIRASVAIALIIYATNYIENRNGKKFFKIWLLALCFHSSMVIVLPFYYLNKLRPTNKQIYILIGVIYFASFAINIVFKTIIDRISQITGMLTAYTGDAEMAEGSGMMNPMIYFQLLILVAFVAAKPYLLNKQYCYYTIRNGYLYSTLILMMFSSLLVIGSRLATVFATYDIFIIPSLLSTLNLKSRVFVLPFVYVILILLFIYNLTRSGDLTYGNYEIW